MQGPCRVLELACLSQRSVQCGAVHKAALTYVAPRYTRGASLLSLFYSRWLETYPSPHRYCLAFIFHFMAYKAGVSGTEPCHIISRHLDCFGPEGWRWGQNRAGSGLPLGHAVQKQPLLPHESQPLAKGTHLQADLGGVQGEGEEVGETGGSPGPQELHHCCGRHL